MKTIGLLGGMSWESTLSYYKAINEGVRQQKGGLSSAKLILNSVDFSEIEALQHAGDWPATATILTQAARAVEKAGADFLLICTNTMHKVAAEISAGIAIPVLHIADATAERLCHDGVTRVGLLGTRFTMEEDFYTSRLSEKFGLQVVTPDKEARKQVHEIIYNELCLGIIRDESRRVYQEIIADLRQQGCQAVILGCTEIALLIRQQDSVLPLYDTTQLHAERAVALALMSE